jgi:adenine C2-methylase RlmN of 23S rRNA A2503 and tRNA A37
MFLCQVRLHDKIALSKEALSMRRITAVIIVFILLIGLLSGCTEQTASTKESISKQKIELVIFAAASMTETLEEISKIGEVLDEPKGRKYALNFALGDNFEVDSEKLRDLFNPNKFMVKITPIHITNACKENNIETKNGYFDYSPYREIEKKLIKVGFDVLVFIPSIEEDASRITCGNAILSDNLKV